MEKKWIEDDYKATQDDSFDNTIQSIKSLTKIIARTNKTLWESWHDNLFNSFNVTEAELSSIEKIDKYNEIYNEFVRERDSFISKRSSLPTDVYQIQDLQELSNRLKALMQDINFNIPQEVKDFFASINDAVKGKKAPLSLLTPEVLKWIQDNNEISNFSITRTFGNR